MIGRFFRWLFGDTRTEHERIAAEIRRIEKVIADGARPKEGRFRL